MPELSDAEYKRLLAVADKDAIRDVLARVSRGVDRLNADILRTAYWPEAKVYSSFFDGPVEDFIAWLIGNYKETAIGAAHNICNIAIELDGETRAWGETYFIGMSENRPAGQEPFNNLTSGRYLDRFEKRDGEWRILQRTFVYELTARVAHHTAWTQPPLADMIRRGRRDGGDMMFAMKDAVFPKPR
ncbi:MAG: nuclear transport factor 2 family protein [Sphingomonadales bacterium]